MKRIVITCSLLLSAVFSSNAATTGNYSGYYTQYKAGAFWVASVTEMGSTPVSNGLGIWDGSGTGGAGIVSESMGYAMILSALYNDKATFDRLSATIQAGIPYGKSNGTATGLFPWSWVADGSNTTFIASNTLSNNVYDSASDGDINIALGYIYADQAKTVYGWADPAGSSYATMAKNYIVAIRQRDFTTASGQSDANKHILCGGADLAIDGWTSGGQVWHPDYSDIRAYQLFSKYDVSYASFWSSAISYTKAAWKAIFDFGTTDTRSTWAVQPPTSGDIGAASNNVWISNPTYGMSSFSSNYTQVKGTRYYYKYDADACRMPMRIMNYVNASENSDAQMTGIASAILSALGSSYTISGFNSLGSSLNIWTPFAQDGNYIQNFIAGGLVALSSNPALVPLDNVCNRATVYTNISNALGANGTTHSTFNTNNMAYNCSVTLWGLTINKNSQNALQRYMETYKTSAAAVAPVTSTATTSPSINSGSTVADVKDIVRSRIQAALTSQGAVSVEDIGRVATILGVSKSNLSKALKLAPASVKSSNGKINIAKLGKFLTKNSKAASLLAGKSTGKSKKSSAKRSS